MSLDRSGIPPCPRPRPTAMGEAVDEQQMNEFGRLSGEIEGTTATATGGEMRPARPQAATTVITEQVELGYLPAVVFGSQRRASTSQQRFRALMRYTSHRTYFVPPCDKTFTIHIVQGSAKRLRPGLVNIRRKNCVLLPAAGRKT